MRVLAERNGWPINGDLPGGLVQHSRLATTTGATISEAGVMTNRTNHATLVYSFHTVIVKGCG